MITLSTLSKVSLQDAVPATGDRPGTKTTLFLSTIRGRPSLAILVPNRYIHGKALANDRTGPGVLGVQKRLRAELRQWLASGRVPLILPPVCGGTAVAVPTVGARYS